MRTIGLRLGCIVKRREYPLLDVYLGFVVALYSILINYLERLIWFCLPLVHLERNAERPIKAH